ncbi:MAG: PVC-type heme-binding CxxCH protein [Bacteroidota bacterium]
MMLNRLLQNCLYGGTLVFLFHCTPPSPSPLSEAEKRMPSHALDSMYLAEDLAVSLFAHEPDLINPTNIDIDDRGRIWVCEGYNYRNHLNPNNPAQEEGDRIVILEDTDGDGKSDSRKVFYQGTDVNSALGISVLGEKVYVSCSPYMFVFTDADGDDLPERKDTLFTAVEGVQHDHALHAVVFGPDGKLYFNFGNEGNVLLDKNGKPFYDRDGNKIEDTGKPYREGMVFRCDEDGSNVEILAHNFRNNYEVAIDSYGTLWQSDNDDDGNRGVRINYVMEHGNYGYKDELTGEGWRVYRTGMSEEIPLRHWHQNDPGVVPNLLQTGAGSPTGMVIYEGNLLPERFWNEMIHTDAGPRIVRAYPVKNQGAGYRATQDTLMYGLGDLWFRPADLCIAPDGSLIVADWYDPGVGGHKVGDLKQGRLYRIASAKQPYTIPQQNYTTPRGAVEALKSPNMSTRFKAWKALENMGIKAEPALKEMWTDPNPRFQARALWLLARLEGKTSAYIQEGLHSKTPELRITALRIAKQLDQQQVLAYCQQLADDSSIQVKREVALALRFEDSPAGAKLWSQLASAYQPGDRWFLEALGIGADRHADLYFNTWMKDIGDEWKTKKNRDIVWRMRASVAGEKLQELIASEVEAKGTHRYFRALDFHHSKSKNKALIGLLAEETHPQYPEIRKIALEHLDPEIARQSPIARKALLQTLDQLETGDTYVRLLKSHLAYLPKTYQKRQYERLQDLLSGDGDNNLKVQTLGILLKQKNGKAWIAGELIQGSSHNRGNLFQLLSLTQSQESFAVLEALMEDSSAPLPDRISAVQAYGVGWSGTWKLYDKLKNEALPEELVEPAANQLLSSWNEDIRKVAATYLPEVSGKETTLPPIEELVSLSGSSENGQQIFQQNCGICHQVGEVGVNFGPALTEIGNKLSKEAMYSSILYPSAGISFNYEGYLVKLQDKNAFTGYIESETESILILRMQGGISKEIEKDLITSMEPLPVSLMPEGLYKDLSQEELVDLVEYLSQLTGDKALASK